jgi:putative hydrolase of the HAD superfamily
VVFDLDDTLIVEEATARRSLVDSANAVLGDVDAEALADVVLVRAREAWHQGPHHPLCTALGFGSWEGLWSTFDGCHPSVDGLREWAPDYRQPAWRLALEETGHYSPQRASAMADAYVERQRAGHPLIAGASEALGALGSTTPLALLTNGPSDIQRTKLRGTGLGDEFGAVVISGETGVGKPDPSAFALVLTQLGVAPEDAVMVGDSWKRDVAGARAVGMAAVWLSAGQAAPTLDDSVTVVESVADVVDALDG